MKAKPRSLAKPVRRAGDKAIVEEFAKAEARFRRMSQVNQRRVIAEVLYTRGSELLLAHQDLLAVGHGRRRQRSRRKTGKGTIVQCEWCILFLVKEKWHGADSEHFEGRLPKRLLCFETIRGRRQLLAIPTDVDQADEPMSLAASTVLVDAKNGNSPATGALTCLVKCRRPDGTLIWRALSCRHVLGLTNIDTNGVEGAEVSFEEVRLGQASSVRGDVVADLARGFDAQAMDVSSLSLTKNALWTWQWPRAYVTYAGEFDEQLWLQLPSQPQPVPATYRGVWSRYGIGYGPPHSRFVGWVGPLVEVELDSGGTTQAGDSGSPLVIGYSQPKLAGMHIAATYHPGIRKHISFCIPAYALLDPARYANASGETWTLP